MSIANRLLLSVLTLLLFWCCAGDVKTEAPTLPPRLPLNILWITVEDMSPRLASFGDPTASTPNLDRLAEEGIRYTSAFSVSGVCAPSRAALITGMYPTAFGAQHMRTIRRTASIDKITDPAALAIPVYEAVPPSEVKCFPEFLRAAGYYCTNNVKTDYQFHVPITAWDESSSEAHWRSRPKGSPFFSVFNFTTTHESQVWARADDPLEIDPADIALPPYYPDTPIIRRDVARHYNNIQLMDRQVGELLGELEEDGLTDSTLIFFFGDHGDGLPRAKRWLYDSGLKVPLIVRFPDRTGAGEANDELVSFVDFAPTVLSIAGLEIPEYMQGQAFLGEQKSATPRDYVFASKDRMDPAIDTARAVRDKRFKYIKNYQPDKPFVQFIPYRDQMGLMQELLRLNEQGQLDPVQQLWFRESKPVEEFYDTWNDPHEVNNLAEIPEYREVLETMRAANQEWVEAMGDPLTLPEDELVRKLWPAGVQPKTADPVLVHENDNTEFDRRVSIRITCETEGASIAYKVGEDSRWLLYQAPIELDAPDVVSAQAIRIGYKPSETVSISLLGR